ncbi:MAG: DUF1211 domain-containing protein [Candidatus Eremiobacteraeota bacterium]|nr:DUF1211 domain-containing protein [Candidatus Eremiobacteraeota bacterium]
MKIGQSSDDERFSHRLEAFSDVVIGFSLAQLSLNLTFPKHVADLFYQPFGLAAFVFTFIVICVFWLRHHRWFAHYFTPTPFNVTLNFVILGAIVLLAYALQIFLHFLRIGSDFFPAFSIYIAAFGAVMLLFGIAYFVGAAAPKRVMTADVRRLGYVQALRLCGAAFGVVVGLFVVSHGTGFETATFVVAFCIAGGALLGRLAGNAYGRRAVP